MILELGKSSLKETIACALCECRDTTVAFLQTIDESTFCLQAHPDFSPIGWHLGHIAYTESFWLLERSAGHVCLFPQYRKLFAADGLPKTERVKLPTIAETRFYLDTVREKVFSYLKVANLEQQERLWSFLLQHESQHLEISTFLLEMLKTQSKGKSQKSIFPDSQLPIPYSVLSTPHSSLIKIPAGEFEMGSNSIDALDNESPAHRVYLDTYYIERYPVTCSQYRLFMEAEGYSNPLLWSQAGWQWLQIAQVNQPLYWHDDSAWDNHPVCGVSWYEADAYSRFVGKRLPTEAEWEKAASWDAKANSRRIYPWEKELRNKDCVSTTMPVDAYPERQSAYGLYDTLGNVWQWTDSWFDAYEGFEYYPYIGYSQVYFDNQHRVLKGGSWATRPWAMRCSFRNWYHPGVRQIFAGFRCAVSES